MGLRRRLRSEDLPSHPRAHTYSGARVPERQLTPEGYEQFAPSLDHSVTETTTDVTVTYTVVGTLEYKVGSDAWAEDTDGSPLVVTKTTSPQMLFLRVTRNNRSIIDTIPIPATEGAGAGVIISGLYAEVDGSNLIHVNYAITGSHNHMHILWRMPAAGSGYTEVTAGEDTFDPEPYNPNPLGSEERTIELYIEAHDASHNIVGVSSVITFTFPADADT